MVELYRQAHVVVLPLRSRIHWGIPNVLIEALATKTPVICCYLPSMRELVAHDESGWIIPEGDPQALAEAVAHLWAEPVLRDRLAESGYRRVVEQFSLEKTGKQLRTLFVEEQRARGRGNPGEMVRRGDGGTRQPSDHLFSQ